MQPEIFTFTGAKPGPHLLVLGGIHGKEVCGQLAGRRLVQQFTSGEFALDAGTLTIVPQCNAAAAGQGRQYIDVNLNRVFYPHAEPSLAEHHLANALCPLVEKADYILDLHSTSAPTHPYVFLDFPDELSRKWVGTLGAGYVVMGWPQLHLENNGEVSTQEYAHKAGRRGLTFECGQHLDAEAPERAYVAALASLQFFGLMQAPMPTNEPAYITLREIHFKKMEGKFPRRWENFSPVTAGEPLATYQDGSVLNAPADGYILLPKEDAEIGEDWLYFASA